jgi:transcriptional regulator with XRE-family HTH domain
MDDKAKRTQDWRDSHPLVVWRKAQDLTSQQAAEKLGITARRLLELEIVSRRPSDAEMKTITERTGINRDQWTAWELANPRGGPAVPPQG